METVYVVQGFQNVGGAVMPEKPLLHGFENLALSHGAELAGQKAGVVVYAQKADTDRGEYSLPVILASYGEIPVFGEGGLVSRG
jgi:hypothetical protein